MSSSPGSKYPRTRYLGSKRKLLSWIVAETRNLQFDSVLDAFGGTASVSYAFKKIGKEVTYNDLLVSNYQTGLALIENSKARLSDNDISWVVSRKKGIRYPSFIQDTFRGFYYKDRENAWLDMAITNIGLIRNRRKRALALHALFQSCLIKRPFNLFHRRNLNMRLARVKRDFNNQKSWNRPFRMRFEQFAREANVAVFSNGRDNTALNYDVFDIPSRTYDLVYLDPPYILEEGRCVDYYSAYHFLEGLCQYQKWNEMIDYETYNRRLLANGNGHSWGKTADADDVEKSFDMLFRRFQDSILLVSYVSPGIPSVLKLKELLEQYKRRVSLHSRSYRYVLNTRPRIREVLLVAR